MSEQQQLVAVTPDESKLTARQAAALDLVRTTPGGIQAVDVGIELHRRRTGDRFPCSCEKTGKPCMYALSGGNQVLKRLRQFGYGLVRRRTGLWEIPGVTPKLNPVGGPGELPEGF